MKAAQTLKNLRDKDVAGLTAEVKDLQKAHFGLRMQKRPEAEVNKSVNWGIELLQIAHLQNRYPHQLSSGEKQRMALARLVARNASRALGNKIIVRSRSEAA